MNTSLARAGAVACAALLLSSSAPAGEKAGRAFSLTTSSKEARDGLVELQWRIENQQFGPANVELARRIVAADPAFAMGAYYLSAVTFPADPKLLDKARELAPAASDGERRFIEAMALARSEKPEQAVGPLTKLARDYPAERIVHILLGQVLAGEGRLADARKEYQAAIALEATTPRAHSLVANLRVLEGDYPGARAAYEKVLVLMLPGTAPGPVRYGIAFSDLDATDKKIWLGKGRTLARMGRYEEAWKEAETIRAMIEQGGERAKEFESGDAQAAVEHLKKADRDDPFQKLLLARAYEKAGDKPKARKAYQEVVGSNAPGLERALAYPEAKKRLASL